MSKLQVKLLRDKPYKIYAANIEVDYHITEICDFLRRDNEPKLEIILNGHKFRFNSIASKNKFIEGFQCAGRIIFKHIKEFANETQGNLNKLTNDLAQTKKKKGDLSNQLTSLTNEVLTYRVVQKIRITAWENNIQEWKDACETLKNRLDRIEPIIDLIRNAESEGDINKAHLIVKKEKL